MSKKRAGIITASVLAAGLAIGGVTTGVVLANRPLDITYYANNGTPAVTTQVNKNETLNLPTPAREGYNFAGWYLDIGLTNQVTKSTKLKNNSKLYAGWEITNGAVLTNTSANGEATVQTETAGLKSIGAGAFANSKIKSVTIPSTVTTIGEGAFQNCTALKEVVIGTGVTTIGNYAFKGCPVTKLTTGGSETSVGSEVFNSVVTDIVLRGTPETYKNAFTQQTTISNIVFNYDNPSLNSNCPRCIVNTSKITFGDNVVTVGSFENITSISNIVWGKNVTTIGEKAFKGCKGLTEVVLPNGLTTINTGAFQDCTNIAQVYIPSSVTTIDSGHGYDSSTLLFLNCDEKMIICCDAESQSSGWTSYWNNINVSYGQGEKYCNIFWAVTREQYNNLIITEVENCKYLCLDDTAYIVDGRNVVGKLTMPSTITLADKKYNIAVQAFAFKNCNTITEVVLPNTITIIEQNMFENCTGLTKIVLPNSVTTIKAGAFKKCTGLKKVYIPSSVTTIYGEWGGGNPVLPFIGCSADLIIYCQFYSYNIPSGYGPLWNCYYAVTGNKSELNVVYGSSSSDM